MLQQAAAGCRPTRVVDIRSASRALLNVAAATHEATFDQYPAAICSVGSFKPSVEFEIRFVLLQAKVDRLERCAAGLRESKILQLRDYISPFFERKYVMNKYMLLLHCSLVAIGVTTTLPAMAATDDADTNTPTQSILRRRVESLNLSVPKEGRNYVEESTPNIASSNIVNGRQTSPNYNDCPAPWGPWEKGFLEGAVWTAAQIFGGSVKRTDIELPCRTASMVKKN